MAPNGANQLFRLLVNVQQLFSDLPKVGCRREGLQMQGVGAIDVEYTAEWSGRWLNVKALPRILWCSGGAFSQTGRGTDTCMPDFDDSFID